MDQQITNFFKTCSKWEAIRDNIEEQCRVHAKAHELDDLAQQNNAVITMIREPGETFEDLLDRKISSIKAGHNIKEKIANGEIEVITVTPPEPNLTP